MKQWIHWSVSLTAADYVHGLMAIKEQMTENQRRLLWAHYNSVNRTNYAKRLAELAGITSGHGSVNLEYWRLAERFCKATNQKPDIRPNGKPRWWSIWSQGYKTKYGYMWQMLPQVAEAIEVLGWNLGSDCQLPEENPLASASSRVERWEGALLRVTVNRYERDADARKDCIAHFQAKCFICGFDFGAFYGPLAAGFIHVHHLKPLSEVGERYKVNPLVDLCPVCPNCHAVLHMGGITRDPEEVRKLIETAKAKNYDH